ncbi:MAG: phasin family protein [Candidatus Pacebacteria bacterium]|nr:phasin family protein [Candidatus Paceibacterota bacterium]
MTTTNTNTTSNAKPANLFVNPFMGSKADMLNSFDYASIVESQKRTVETMNRATKLVTDAVRDVMTRQASLAQSSMTEFANICQDMMGAKDFEQIMQKQINYNRGFAEKTNATSGECVEICVKTTNNAMNLLRNRAEEVVSELNGAYKTAVNKADAN